MTSINKFTTAIEHIIKECGNLKHNEKLLILFDSSTEEIARLFEESSRKVTQAVNILKIEDATVHGSEPGEEVKQAMLASNLIICLTKMSLAHTQARLEAFNKGVRFLSMPDYSFEVLSDPSIMVDYKAKEPITKAITTLLDRGTSVKIISEDNSELNMNIKKRMGNCCPGFVDASNLLGSPPDIEVNIAPIENQTSGKVLINGSITCPEIGLLKDPVLLDIQDGRIVNFLSNNKTQVDTLKKVMDAVNDTKAYIVGELGIGLNDRARLTGNMLIDEGAAGCIHLGFGSNYTIGGANKVSFHLDFVMKNASLYIDEALIIDRGKVNL